MAAEPPSGEQVLNGQFGSKVQELFKRFNIDQFMSRDIYGNLRTVKRETLVKKKAKLATSFGKLTVALTRILREGVPASNQEMPTFKELRTYTSLISRWREVLAKHPHQWPQDSLLSYLMDLNARMVLLDNTSGHALSLNEPARFDKLEIRELLPGASFEFFNFEFPKFFEDFRTLYVETNEAIREICSPSYEWRIAITANVRAFLGRCPTKIDGIELALKNMGYSNINKAYLKEIGCISYEFDFTRLIMSVGQSSTVETGRSIIDGMLSQRDATARVFGSSMLPEIEKLGDQLKEVSDT